MQRRGKVLTVIRRVLDGGCGVVSGGKAERSRDNGVRVSSDITSDIGPEGVRPVATFLLTDCA